MSLIFTKSIIQHKFYIDVYIEIDINIFPGLDLIISAPHWYMVLHNKAIFV